MNLPEIERARSEGLAAGLRLAATLLTGGELLKDATAVLLALADEEADCWSALLQNSPAASESRNASES
jgi:hypothetical protein